MPGRWTLDEHVEAMDNNPVARALNEAHCSMVHCSHRGENLTSVAEREAVAEMVDKQIGLYFYKIKPTDKPIHEP